ncbi:GAF domain-containing protein, partial [Nocardia nova]|uniref:GAF domain-containing protein n=1 Tax=Nocardia nova TaxID=37330 RepID=UPI0025B0FFEC
MRRQLAAFRDLAAALAEERDLDAIFHLIVDTLSSLTGADRCSLHLRDPETGLLRGQAAHAPQDIDGLVKQLVSGLPGDDFTREILETHRPVMVTNTFGDPRTVQAAMRRWRARSVLGVPMVLRGDVIGLAAYPLVAVRAERLRASSGQDDDTIAGSSRASVSASEISITVEDNGGCYVVPAFSGLFAHAGERRAAASPRNAARPGARYGRLVATAAPRAG